MTREIKNNILCLSINIVSSLEYSIPNNYRGDAFRNKKIRREGELCFKKRVSKLTLNFKGG